MRRIRRTVRAVSTFLTQLGAALLKAVVTTMIVVIFVVSIMHYMGVPMPHVGELLRGVSRLTRAFS